MGQKTNDTHIVEIPVNQEFQDDEQQTKTAMMIQQHPMMEISQSPGHLLLLKLWQREEHLFALRISLNETKLDHLRREIFHLCCSFLVFHAFVTTLLFAAESGSSRCKKWWIPSMVVGSTSAAIVVLLQLKLWRYWKVTEKLRREKTDSRTLGRAIQELRMKGESFDLSKEMSFSSSSKKKSSSVEIKWTPKIWCSNNIVTVCLLIFAGLAFPAPKLGMLEIFEFEG
ncbi:Trigger factor [Bienertia sinuspersici]